MRPTTDPRGENRGRLPPLRADAAPGGRHARFEEARDGPRRRPRAPEIKNARIERGDSPRAISRRTDGAGDCYTPIRDANEDQIRDSDLIHPGQVLVLRGEDTIDAARTGSAPEETATMIQFTKIVTYVVAAMAALTLVLVVLQTTSMLAGS